MLSRGQLDDSKVREREFFIDNLLVRIHFIIVMIRWTGLAPWEFEFPLARCHPHHPPLPSELKGFLRLGLVDWYLGGIRHRCSYLTECIY